MSKPQSHKPHLAKVHSGIHRSVSRRVKQRGQQIQHRSLSKYSTGISSTQAVALWRRCRECVCKVDNSPEGQSSENNARNERRTERSRLRYHVGPHTCPWWTGPEEPGAPSPSAWLERRNVGLRGTTNNGSAILFYWWVPTDRPNLRLGSRKGTYCPKWEV